MRTTSQSSGKIPKPIPTETPPEDALSLLIQDHDNVKALFEQYDALGDRAHVSKHKLALQICEELTKHTMIEEEIFYPAVRQTIKDDDIMDESLVEHASAKDLIAQIQTMEPSDDLFDAKVTVLSEMIEHHVGEEENDMFPKVRKTKLNLQELGQQMATRKEQIQLPPV
ncbi:hemerythrin domain-containing protein [Duganella sp. FT50W]|uniref:Hemerythrin domain-containing protein n=1 Tax=Duganella lactea TaxID=2692173 RepID=A0A6L8MPG1_9BURK|nr:hemerythrin domain-containing protein [Duganella lactea]MYM35698.1 hemerythrin domain-containing protein [Duganella lactea]MYM84331.1 hemerythrin domain-containing protein [Duganella lactea]